MKRFLKMIALYFLVFFSIFPIQGTANNPWKIIPYYTNKKKIDSRKNLIIAQRNLITSLLDKKSIGETFDAYKQIKKKIVKDEPTMIYKDFTNILQATLDSEGKCEPKLSNKKKRKQLKEYVQKIESAMVNQVNAISVTYSQTHRSKAFNKAVLSETCSTSVSTLQSNQTHDEVNNTTKSNSVNPR